MIRDKKWFVDKWTKERDRTDVHTPMYYFINDFIADVNRLDEPEVLSAEWIEGNTSPVDDEGRLYIWKRDLENLIVPKQESVAPLIVPEDLGVLLEDMELGKSNRYFTMIDSLFHWWDNTVGSPTGDFIAENKKELIEIIIGNREYEVEDEPKYHALIKGYELVSGYDIYWNYDKYDNGVFVSRLNPPHDNFLTEMTKEDWFEIGITDSIAHFVEVEENE